MANIDKVLDAFIAGDYFLVFLAMMLIILVVLVIALIKSRDDYNQLLTSKDDKSDILNNPILTSKELDNKLNNVSDSTKKDEEPIDELDLLKATSKEDTIDENKPLIKQIDIPSVKTYDDIIDDYESNEEENAVISADELEKRTKERLETLGINDNQAAIQKYEEDQEKKAIISYEQLLKNASNITLSYVDESSKKKGAPKVNKIEIEQKEVTGVENYLEEEEFLNILKEFRTTL